MLTLAIDPGARTGWALFDELGALVVSGTAEPHSVPRPRGAFRVVIEWPRERTGGARQAHGAALVTLAAHAGLVLGALGCEWARVTRLYPDEWKGQIPKPVKGAPYIIAERAARILGQGDTGAPTDTAAELDRWDAIGLGLVFLRRAQRGFK